MKYIIMWKKKIENNNSTLNVQSSACPLNLFSLDKKDQEFLIDEDEDEIETFWDANVAKSFEWTTEKFSDFLACHPTKVPQLKQILKEQKSPYNCNPCYYCKFKAIDSYVYIWISGTLLYHVSKYKQKYMKFLNAQK